MEKLMEYWVSGNSSGIWNYINKPELVRQSQIVQCVIDSSGTVVPY